MRLCGSSPCLPVYGLMSLIAVDLRVLDGSPCGND